MKIAIVEDHEDDSDSYAELIRAAWDDVEIDQLFNEEQAKIALSRAEESRSPYDLISLDIDLSDNNPEIDTFGGFRILKELDPRIRSTVLVVTSQDLTGPTASLLNALQIVDILSKPHSPADYLRAVRLGLQAQNKCPTQQDCDPLSVKHGNLVLSPIESTWNGRNLPLTLTQIRILWMLVEAAPSPVPIYKLKKALPSLNPQSEAVTVQISEIRSKLRAIDDRRENMPIKSVPGGGYNWSDI